MHTAPAVRTEYAPRSQRSTRLIGAACALVAAFALVAGPALDLVRLDPVVQSAAVGCSFEGDVSCPSDEAAAALESFGLLDAAERVYQPWLMMTRNVPAMMLLAIAVLLAAPRVRSATGRFGLGGLVAVVVLTMVVPQLVYADTLDAVSFITE